MTRAWLQAFLGCCSTWAEPAFSTILLAQVHEKLGSMLRSLEPALQVDLVWALCVLQQVRESELQTVLNPGLHKQFLGEDSAPHTSCNMETSLFTSQGRNWSRDRRPEHTKHTSVAFFNNSLQLAYRS